MLQESDPAEEHCGNAMRDAPAPKQAQGAEQKAIHPQTARLFASKPCTAHIPLFSKAATALGPKFTLSLGFGYLLSKGAGSNMINLSRQPMFMVRYGTSAARYQRLASMYSLGWSLKPFIAAITDVLALFGYTKRWYLVASAVVGTAFSLAYAFLPASPSSADPAAAFVFLICFGKANVDILTEGQYSRVMRSHPESGPAVVSWVWAMTFIGTMISACMMGPLSDAKLTWVGVVVAAGFQFITIFFFALNLYGEKKNRTERRMDALLAYRARQEECRALRETAAEGEVVDGDVKDGAAEASADGVGERSLVQARCEGEGEDAEFEEPRIISYCDGAAEVNVDVAQQNWRLLVCAAIMTMGIIVLACVTVLGTRWQLLYACIPVAVVFCACAFWALPLVVAKAAVFMYLNSVLYIQIPGALQNFYLASEKCLPEGPHFSYTFYQTVGALITDVGGVAGAILFTYVFAKRGYPFVFVATTLLQIAGSIFDLILVERWNIYIGIPDHAMYLLGDAIVYEICFVMSIMPAQILMSRLCTRGTESIAFALLSGFSSAGNSMSLAIGSLLMESVWPVSTKPPCDFSNVPYLILTGHFCAPLLIVPLAFLLLPRTRICDLIDAEVGKTDQKSACVSEETKPPKRSREVGQEED